MTISTCSRGRALRHLYILVAPLLILAASWVPRAWAVTPETGLYYDSLRQGLGYYVEVQGTTLVFVSFAYDQETSKPLFYIASGPITKAKPAYSSIFDPPAELRRENAFQFDEDIYRIDAGPCITCGADGWDTPSHAQVAGHVYLRFADVNRLFVSFKMNDGTEISSFVRRQAFGRNGYNIRQRSFWTGSGYDQVPQPLAGFLGTWVFTDLEDYSESPLLLSFDVAEGPFDDGKYYFGSGYASHATVRFSDMDRDAIQTCFFLGCGLEQHGDLEFYTKFWDIGSDYVLAYKGDRLEVDDEGIDYRGEYLISGIRIADPIPDAPPPPEEP